LILDVEVESMLRRDVLMPILRRFPLAKLAEIAKQSSAYQITDVKIAIEYADDDSGQELQW